MKLEIDIDAVAAGRIACLEKEVAAHLRKNGSLKTENGRLKKEVAQIKANYKEIRNVRDAIVEAAYQLEPYFGD